MTVPKEYALTHVFVPNLKWSSYWGTISRVLAGQKRWHDGQRETEDMVEVNVTPVNGWDAYDATEQVANIKIRRHCTVMGKRDEYLNLIHRTHVERLTACAGEENAYLILHGDLLPLIDWDKYRRECNGGADLAKILKAAS